MTEERTDAVHILVLAQRPPEVSGLLPTDRRILSRVIRRADDIEGVLEIFEPEVVLVDVTLPDGDGYTAIEELTVMVPGTPVLALTPEPAGIDHVARAAQAGAVGFVEVGADPADVGRAIDAVRHGRTWFPSDEVRPLLSDMADQLDTSHTERRSRLTSVILGLIPLTGLIAAIQAAFLRRYLGDIGVRPVDIAVDPASRTIDIISAMLLVTGIVGPLLFVGSWIDIARRAAPDGSWAARVLGHRAIVHVAVSIAWLAFALTLAVGPDTLLVVFLGPVVVIAVAARILGVDDELPEVVRMRGLNLGAVLAAAFLTLATFVGVLIYEVMIVGPDLRTDGVHGWIAPRVLGINAIPMHSVNVNTGIEGDVLYLGGNADLYVLIDPCDGNRVDMVSVGAHRLTVIDEVACP